MVSIETVPQQSVKLIVKHAIVITKLLIIVYMLHTSPNERFLTVCMYFQIGSTCMAIVEYEKKRHQSLQDDLAEKKKKCIFILYSQ